MKTLNLGGTLPNKLHVVSDVWYAWPEQLAEELQCDLNYICLADKYCFQHDKYPKLTVEQAKDFEYAKGNPSPLLWLYTLSQLDIKENDIVIGLVPSCERDVQFKTDKEIEQYCNASRENKNLVDQMGYANSSWHQWKHINSSHKQLSSEFVAFQSVVIFEQLKLFTTVHPNSLFFMFQDHVENNPLIGVKTYSKFELERTNNIVAVTKYREDEQWSPMLEWIRQTNNLNVDTFKKQLDPQTNNLNKHSQLWVNAIKSHIVR